MNIRFYEEADIVPFHENINFTNKITLVIFLITLSNNILSENNQFILYITSFFLLNFFLAIESSVERLTVVNILIRQQ